MNHKAPGLREVHSILCDDVRQEVGNKPSYMGVYTGAMLLPSVPLQHPGLFIAKAFSHGEPNYRAALKLVDPSGKSLLAGNTDLMQGGAEFSLLVGLGSVRFEQAGLHEIFLTLTDPEGKELEFRHTFEVRVVQPQQKP